jgi:zinc transport system permease protein
VVVVACLGLAGLVVVAALYRSLVAAALDEDAARVSGVPVAALNVFLAALAGVTIAVSMRIVGILLIAALMVLPVTAASRVAWSIRSTMLLSMAIGVASVLAGLTISYYANLAPGGAIVLVAAGAFVLASLGEALAS